MIGFDSPSHRQNLLVHISTLGRVTVEQDGRPLSLRRKDILLLAYAAIEGRAIARLEAASLLWGEATDKAARLSLRQAIWRLRAEVGDALQVSTSDIRTDPRLLTVDVRELAAHVSEGRYREAVGLAGGVFLADADAGATNEFESWVEDVRSRAGTQLATALQQLVRDAARRGNWPEAARFAQQWSDLSPRDPEAALEHARALRAGGRAPEALARLQAFGRTAERDLGAAPSADMQQLLRELRIEAERAPSVAPDGDAGATPHLRLVTLWERAVFGRSGCAFVLGQSGETTRFTRTFLEWVRARGEAALIAHAVATPSNQCPPWHALQSILDGLRTAPGLSGASDEALAVLAAFSPALCDRFPRLEVGARDPNAVPDALRRVLDVVAEETTVVICVDADDCDDESAAVLVKLMANPPARLLLILTSQTAPLPAASLHRLSASATTIALPGRGSRTRVFAAALAMAALIVSAALVFRARVAAAEGPIAIGTINVVGQQDSLGLTTAVPGLLASKLALVPALSVVSSARMYEVREQLRTRDARGIATIARRAGARTLIEGEIYKQGGHMRLALRRVRISSGQIEQSFEVSSENVFALVDEAADQIARSYNADVPRQSIADVTTSSIVAYRFYEEGLRALYQNDPVAAYRDFRAALAQDSTFAMAAYYAAQAAADPADALRLFQLAVRLGEHAGDHDRLRIQAQWAVRNGSHSLYPIAETLAIRYPHDADGQYYYGLANHSAGRFDEAARRFQLALSLDSLALLGHSVPCRACEAINNLINTKMMSDSLRVAEQIARKWVALQPWSLNAWTSLGGVLEFQGRYAEADSAFTHAESVQPELSDLAGHRFELALRAGRFAAVDSMLAVRLASEDADEVATAMFHNLMNLRAQGRLREALATARTMREREPNLEVRTGMASLEARVLVEMGRHAAAAAMYDSVARFVIRTADPRDQRHAGAWLANVAGALAAQGDTTRLAELEQQIRYYGSMSVEKRDRTLYRYVHGLRQELAGDVDGAIESYRAALLSPTSGNVRASLALGRALIARGRASEAIPILDAAVRGSLGASGTPVTKTELRATLGQAYEATGQIARARGEYAWVLNAWRRADPEFRVRRAAIQQRLERLQES